MKKKTGLKFAFTMIVCGVLGGISSLFVRSNIKDLSTIFNSLSDTIIKNSTILMLIGVIPLIIGSILIKKAKNIIKANADLDEHQFEKTNKMLCMALSIPSVMMPWSFICFGFSATYSFRVLSVHILVDLLLFIIEMVWITIIQYKTVEETKKIFPEKKGNVLDNKFQKEWYSSCDEAERQIIGEACYKSYKTMSVIYPILFVIMIIICTVHYLSPFIFLMVGMLWLVQMLSYLIPSYKLEHGKKSRR